MSQVSEYTSSSPLCDCRALPAAHLKRPPSLIRPASVSQGSHNSPSAPLPHLQASSANSWQYQTKAFFRSSFAFACAVGFRSGDELCSAVCSRTVSDDTPAGASFECLVEQCFVCVPTDNLLVQVVALLRCLDAEGPQDYMKVTC